MLDWFLRHIGPLLDWFVVFLSVALLVAACQLLINFFKEPDAGNDNEEEK